MLQVNGVKLDMPCAGPDKSFPGFKLLLQDPQYQGIMVAALVEDMMA